MLLNPHSRHGGGLRTTNQKKPDLNSEIAEYFQKRERCRRSVHVTRTGSGQTLDWVPIESQLSFGEIAATPPPMKAVANEEKTAVIQFELHNLDTDRGPVDTVPILRKNITSLHDTRSLAQHLSKRGGAHINRKRPHQASVDPDPENFFHAVTEQSVVCYGCTTWLNVWQPYLETSNDHSIMQLGLQNYDLPQVQSLEAGWTCDYNLNGSWAPHLFTYYTTNGYSKDGDNLGGYNNQVDGWVQVSQNIYPGIVLSPVSTIGGVQYGLAIGYTVYNNNWWFWVQNNADGSGEWIGYYPSWLFFGAPGESLFTTLGASAQWVGFWGEVYSGLADPFQTATQMGSGTKAETGYGEACFQKNLSFMPAPLADTVSQMGLPSAEDTSFYDIQYFADAGGSWGSFFYGGGPGAFLVPPQSTVTALSRFQDHIDLFVVDRENGVYTNWWDANGGWFYQWFRLPDNNFSDGFTVPLHSTVAPLCRFLGHIDLFVVGFDGGIYTTWWDINTNWANRWDRLSDDNFSDGFTILPRSSVTPLCRFENHIDLFVVGRDGGIYTNWWDASIGWLNRWDRLQDSNFSNGFVALPGSSVSSLCRFENHIDLFVVGIDGGIYTNWWDNNTGWFNRWDRLSDNNFNNGFLCVPGTAVTYLCRFKDHIDLFVVGIDGGIYTSWWDASTGWLNSWIRLPDNNFADGFTVVPGSTVTALSRFRDHLDLFVVGRDGGIYTTWWDVSSGWFNQWDRIDDSNFNDGFVVEPRSVLTTLCRFENHIDLFVAGSDSGVYTTWWDASSGWLNEWIHL